MEAPFSPFIRTFLFLALWPLSTFCADTFYSPIFERFDIAEMETRYEHRPGSESEWQLGLLEFFQAEYHRLAGHPHQSNAFLKAARGRCERLSDSDFSSIDTKEQGRFGYLCALVEAEARANLPSHFSLNQSLRKYWKLGREAVVSEEERLYAEGRLAFCVPPSLGQDFRSALVKLTFLQHLKPEISSVDFWLGRAYELQGNEQAAIAAFARAARHSPPDARTRFVFEDGRILHPRVDNDGLGYGFQPGVFFSPATGLGLEASVFDDRMFDTERSFSASVSAATRGVFTGQGVLRDGATLSDYVLEAGTKVFSGVQDFYGLGPSSSLSNLSELQYQIADFWLSARRALPFSFYLTVGWKLSTSQVTSSTGDFAALALPDVNGLTYTGPFAELGFDTRDSAWRPRNGSHLAVRGLFPTTGLGSPITFQAWELSSSTYFPLSTRQTLSVGLGARDLEGVAPFSSYSMLNGSFHLPAVRDNRFQDRDLLGLFTEYRYLVWGPLSLGAFVDAGTVGSAFSPMLSSRWNWGGGVSVELSSSRYRSHAARLEVGYFASETIIQAVVGEVL